VSGHRFAVSALLGAAAILLAMIWIPPAALAQSITILSAGPDANGDPYDLTIVASDGNGNPIQTMTAHVYSESDQDVADVTMTAVSTSDPTDQTFVAASPIPESALPAGTYTVTVDAYDGETYDGLPTPGFSFAYSTSGVTVAATPPTVTQGSQTVTFAGQLTGTAPGGTPIGIANAPVMLSISGGTPAPLSENTDTNGDFSYTATDVTQNADYNFSVDAASTYPAANRDITVDTEQSAATMTVSASPTDVTAGNTSVTFSGTVSMTPPGAQSATGIGSGVPVYLAVGSGAPAQVTTTDDANGDFSVPESDITSAGDYTFSVNPDGSNPLYSTAQASVSVGTAAAPATISVTPPGVITFGSTSTTLSGTVTAIPAGSSTLVPIADAPVYLNGSSTSFASTDASGHFSYPVSDITSDTDYSFSVNPGGTDPLYTSASDTVPVDVAAGTTGMQVTANPSDVNLGSSTVTFSGTVSVTPSGSSTAQGIGSGVPVYLSVGDGAAQQVATTDSGGGFSYTATGVTQAADYDFSVNGSTANYYTAAAQSVPIGLSQVKSALTVTPSPASVTEGSQSVTFSGTLSGVAPGSSTSVAIQNAPVYLNGGSSAVATTDANGDFTYAAHGIGKPSTFEFSVPSSSTYTAVMSGASVAVDQARTRITRVGLTPPHLKYGQTATLTGTVQYLGGGSWSALAGAVVHLAEGKTILGTATANSSGVFTARLPSTHGAAWSATVDAATLTLQASATGSLVISVPLQVKSFTAGLGVNDKVSASGCLEVTVPVGYGPETSVEIQYSAGLRGPWRTLGSLLLHNVPGKNRSCPTAEDSYFSGAIRAKLANAYYRADFPATDSFQGAVSNAIHSWKYQTRIVSFNATPRKVGDEGVVTITGRLELLGKSWQGWGGQAIHVIYNDKGTSYWGSLGSTKTNSRGYFTLKAAGGPGNFVAITYGVYAGDKTHLASQSAGIAIINDGGAPKAATPKARLTPVRPPALQIPMLSLAAQALPIADLVRS
jgi:hypothetical protein